MDTTAQTIATPPGSGSGRVSIDVPALVATEEEAARLLRLSVRTMQRLRLDGDGPRFIRLTGRRIGYAIGDLQDWVRARSVASTSEATVRATSREAA